MFHIQIASGFYEISDVSVKITFIVQISKNTIDIQMVSWCVHCFKGCHKATIFSNFCEAKGTFKWLQIFMNCSNVNLEMNFVSKRWWAHFTFKWFQFFMHRFDVYLEVLLDRVDIEIVSEYHELFSCVFKVPTQSKCKWACFTLKWFKGFMNCCDVRIETTCASKFQGTQLALKWFQIFMNCSYVFSQAAFMSKFCETKGTIKLLNVFMNCFYMNTEVIFCSKFWWTDLTF
jgi:hypothetical protein